MEEDWKTFQEGVVSSAKEVCGVRKLGSGRRRKGSEWWNVEVKQVVREREKKAYNSCLQGRDIRWC